MRRPGSPRKLEEWVDGFLFLGNHLALDFLNTKPILEGQPRELLLNVVGLERWLIAAGLVRSRKERSLVQRWRNSPEGEAFVRKLVAFRERFRAAVLRLESGLRPKEGFVAEVNVLLKMHALHTNLTKQGPKLALIRFFEPRKADDVWAPIASAVAHLLTEVDPGRIRKCESESCVIHFYDTSKKGSRRWCSMNICGNKLKVSAYQRRQRLGG